MNRLWSVIGFSLAMTCAAADDPPAPREFDLGFIASRQRDVHGDMRFRLLGPFFERATSGEGRRLTALRPLISSFDDPVLERRRREYLWPVAVDKRFRDEAGGHMLLLYWQRFDLNDPKSRYRFWLLPIYFQGRDKDGAGYVALFPLGGSIHEFLGRDEIDFLLFPAFLRHEINTVETRSFLWPIFSRTEGKGIYRVRVFPFYGQARHRDKFNKKFVLWPFWTSAEYFYPGSSGKGYILFPLYGRTRLDDQQSRMVLPPFFRFTRGDRINETVAFWPVFRRTTGEVEKLYIWPIWGRKAVRGSRSTFVAWPVIHSSRVDHGDEVQRRLMVLPFFYSEVKRERALESAEGPRARPSADYKKVWPLGSYRREGDVSRFRTLDLWPMKHTPAIERNYAPLWTLYSHTRIAEDLDSELLWGLIRHRRRAADASRYTSIFPLIDWSSRAGEDESARRWSILKGLIGYEREGTRKSVRLLYLLKLGGKEAEP